MKASELDAILVIARSAAREAAALARQGFRRHPAVEHKGAVDLVTQFDRDSETLLRARLGAAFSFDIVGEEQGGSWNPATPAFFIDPIDGTTNFVHGHPFWCVSIGLVVGGVETLGVVVAPMLGLEWSGWIADDGERKALRNETEPCVVSAMARFEDSLLATGFPYRRFSRTEAWNR